MCGLWGVTFLIIKTLCMLNPFGTLYFLLVLSVEHVKGGEVQAHIKAFYKNNTR